MASNFFIQHPTALIRIASKQLNIQRPTVSYIKVRKLGITAQTRKKAPKYIKDQEARAKKGLRKFYKKILKKILDIDDDIRDNLR